MPGLPYQQLERDTPESIVDNYLQRGLQDIQDKYALQWDEVNRRGPVLGQRKANEMLANIDMRWKQEIQEFQQRAQQQTEQLQRIDRLAQQAGTDPYEAKMRAVLGPEEEMAAFPKPVPEERPPSVSELRSYESWLERKAPDIITAPAGTVKTLLRARPGSWWPWKEKPTRPVQMVYDPDLEPVYDKEKKVWTKGGYRPTTEADIWEKSYFESELKKVRRELRSQPDIATRIRGAALRVKRDPEHTSFDTKVQQSKPKPKAPPVPKEQNVIRQRNTRTGQVRISYDGGKTWQMSG